MNTGGSSSAQPTFLADTTEADISRAQVPLLLLLMVVAVVVLTLV